jgi:RNA polymerase sigma factor (sigma-70 family)
MYNKGNSSYTATYAEMIAKYPMLTAEQERGWFRKFIHGKGAIKEKARDVLFGSNFRYVLKYAHKYYARIYSGSNITLEDLVNSGCEGLSIAINGFNRNLGVRLTTYATHWINKYILDYITSNSSPVYISSNIMAQSKKYERMIKENSSVSDKEVRKELNISEKTLAKTKSAKVKSIYLDEKVGEDGDKTKADYIKDEKAKSPIEILSHKEQCAMLHNLLNTLNPVSRDIIVLRYLNGGEKSKLSVVGKKYGVSGERIRQLEVSGLKSLRRNAPKELIHLMNWETL